MRLRFFAPGFFLAAVLLLPIKDAAAQQKPASDTGCNSYIEIHGSSNVNQFKLINYNPNIVRLPAGNQEKNRYQRIEIPVKDFKGANKRMRRDFLKMVNASQYPYIIMTIEPRNLAECRKSKGLSDFKTEITIAGVSQNYVVPCSIDTCKSSGYVLKGNLEVELTDFGIEPPGKFFGLIKVNNEVLVNYAFRFQADDAIFRSELNGKPVFQSYKPSEYDASSNAVTCFAAKSMKQSVGFNKSIEKPAPDVLNKCCLWSEIDEKEYRRRKKNLTDGSAGKLNLLPIIRPKGMIIAR